MILHYRLYIFLFFFVSISNAQSDCVNAITICGNTGYNGLTITGLGNIEELTSVNSCGFGENNSIWLKLAINNGGTLSFILTPESTDIEEDFDFYLFGPDPNCNSLGNTIRCSTTNPLAAGSSDNLTGMIDTESDTFEGPGADGNNYVQSLLVASGEFYYLVIDRPVGYSNFSIQWTGTATFNNPPTINIPSGTSLNLKSCDNDGSFDESTPFNLSQNTPVIVNSQTNVSVTYHTSSNDAIIGLDAIPNTTNYENISNPQTIYARITDSSSGCFEITSFLIETNHNIVLSNSEFSICDTNTDGDDTNGKATFNINDLTSSFFAGQNISTSTIKYYLSQNDADNNINQITLPFSNTIPNQQSIFIKMIDGDNCEIIVEAYLKVKALPTSNNQTLTQCSGVNSNGISVFNLTDATNSFLNSNLNLSVFYYLNATELANNNPLNATFTNTTNPQTLLAKVTDNLTNCYRIKTLTLTVNTNAGRLINPLEKCDSVTENGLATFNLNDANLNLVTNETATFHESENDALLGINPITNINSYSNTIPYLSSVYVKINNGTNCQGISELKLIVNKLPEIEDSIVQICNATPTFLIVPPIYSSYIWESNPLVNSNQILVTNSGQYKVKVTNAKGCEASKHLMSPLQKPQLLVQLLLMILMVKTILF